VGLDRRSSPLDEIQWSYHPNLLSEFHIWCSLKFQLLEVNNNINNCVVCYRFMEYLMNATNSLYDQINCIIIKLYVVLIRNIILKSNPFTSLCCLPIKATM
jgi:hypothetical protein